MRQLNLIQALAIVAILIHAGSVMARTVLGEFIREPGRYSLDGKGSTLTIDREPAGTWALKVEWREDNTSSSIAPKDCLLAKGWFVFAERRGRIWAFDGVKRVALLTHEDNSQTVKSFSSKLPAACPQKVWEALPETVQLKFRKAKPKRQ
jgi:hypothetical protein